MHPLGFIGLVLWICFIMVRTFNLELRIHKLEGAEKPQVTVLGKAE